MMARTAEYRDDVSGAIVTGGTSTAYTVTSFQVFDTLAHLGGQMIAFTPHTTNAATVTLNVDGLGAKPLRSAPSVELLAGTIIQGTPYVAVYNNSDAAFYLRSFFGNPYNVPLGAGMDFWLPTAPNSSFVFPIGQAISRTTYSALFALMSTTFGTGDGSTTFNIPDKRGRVSAAADASANRLTGATVNFQGLSGIGGAETHVLTTSEMPVHNHGITDAGHSHTVTINSAGGTGFVATSGSGSIGTVTSSTATTGITVNNAGSGQAHAILQPTIICNYILRII